MDIKFYVGIGGNLSADSTVEFEIRNSSAQLVSTISATYDSEHTCYSGVYHSNIILDDGTYYYRAVVKSGGQVVSQSEQFEFQICENGTNTYSQETKPKDGTVSFKSAELTCVPEPLDVNNCQNIKYKASISLKPKCDTIRVNCLSGMTNQMFFIDGGSSIQPNYNRRDAKMVGYGYKYSNSDQYTTSTLEQDFEFPMKLMSFLFYNPGNTDDLEAWIGLSHEFTVDELNDMLESVRLHVSDTYYISDFYLDSVNRITYDTIYVKKTRTEISQFLTSHSISTNGVSVKWSFELNGTRIYSNEYTLSF